jgi:hypothetical protein
MAKFEHYGTYRVTAIEEKAPNRITLFLLRLEPDIGPYINFDLEGHINGLLTVELADGRFLAIDDVVEISDPRIK